MNQNTNILAYQAIKKSVKGLKFFIPILKTPPLSPPSVSKQNKWQFLLSKCGILKTQRATKSKRLDCSSLHFYLYNKKTLLRMKISCFVCEAYAFFTIMDLPHLNPFMDNSSSSSSSSYYYYYCNNIVYTFFMHQFGSHLTTQYCRNYLHHEVPRVLIGSGNCKTAKQNGEEQEF